MKEPFTVFKRADLGRSKSRCGFVWYVRYRHPETGERTSAKCIDVLNRQLGDTSNKRVTSKTKAVRIAQKALDSGLIVFKSASESGNVISFCEYVKALWDFDTSDYIRRKNREKANSLTRAYCASEYQAFVRHVEPALPDQLLLSEFQPSMAEKVKNRMLDEGLAASTINKTLQSIRTPLDEAYRTGLLEKNLADRIRNVAVQNKEKGIPTMEEVMSMLDYLDKHTEKASYERGSFLIMALATYTGMRQGEIRALKASDIVFLDDSNAKIVIAHAYNDADGYKVTKGKDNRTVPAPVELCVELLSQSYLNPVKDGYIFFSLYKPEVPVSGQLIGKRFREAMAASGLPVEELEERNITFHSLRHFYTTTLSEAMSDDEVRKLLGHKSLAMKDHYTHETAEHLIKRNRERESVLPFLFG